MYQDLESKVLLALQKAKQFIINNPDAASGRYHVNVEVEALYTDGTITTHTTNCSQHQMSMQATTQGQY